MRIKFDPRSNRNKTPFGAVPVSEEIFFRITVSTQHGEGAPRDAVLFILRDGQEEAEQILGVWQPADRGDEREPDDRASEPEYGRAGEDETEGFVFSYAGTQSGLYFYRFSVGFEGGETEETPEFQLTLYDRDYQTPDWLSKGLMYQIFPDRFAKSSGYVPPRQNKRHTLRTDWGGVPNDRPDSSGTVWNDDFFGGNLKGITERLDQLAELGVTVLYLNPIFSAFSNHRYDTADYLHIDPMLGTEEHLRELCCEAAVRGIRILLDGVFNHTGCDSIYFNKYGRFPETGAYQSRESPYFSWYTFTDYPEQYDCWWGVNTLPAVNKMEPSYVEYVLTGPDSVVRHWMRCGVWGFRLDVADELPDFFLDTLRQVVKEENPEAAVIGEVWEDASNKISYGNRRRYLQGKQLDSVMNYPVKDGIIRFILGEISAKEFYRLLGSLQEHYPKPAFSCLMNILGTHDTARIFTVLAGGDGTEEPSWEKSEERKGKGRSRLFLALLIWAFLPGIPCVYYGDELGMEGGRDPQNRRCYAFESRDQSVYAFYRRLLRFRMRVPDLERMELFLDQAHDSCEVRQEGSGPFLEETGGKEEYAQEGTVDSGWFLFSRIGTDCRLLVLVNPGTETVSLSPKLSSGECIADFLTAGMVDFSDLTSFHLSPGAGAAVLVSKTNRPKPSVTK